MTQSTQHRINIDRIGLFIGFVLAVAICQAWRADAILNCFPPAMFKGGKFGTNPLVPGQVLGGADRASWYPQSQQLQPPKLYSMYPQARFMFQPKWKSSLFGPKKWMDWRMMSGMYGSGFNYYPQMAGYSTSDPLSVAQLNGMSKNAIGPQSYSNWSPQLLDGWPYPSSAPNFPKTPAGFYQHGTTTATEYPSNQQFVPSKQQFGSLIDPYSTKGGESANYKTTTKK